MKEFVKIEIARDILNFLIGINGHNGYDKNNKFLMQVLADEKALKNGDKEVVDKIINDYGPMVRDNKHAL